MLVPLTEQGNPGLHMRRICKSLRELATNSARQGYCINQQARCILLKGKAFYLRTNHSRKWRTQGAFKKFQVTHFGMN